MPKYFPFHILLAFLFLVLITSLPRIRRNKLRSQTFRTDLGWGYDIKVNGQVLIRQETVPLPGYEHGFRTEEQAEEIAELVMEKLEKDRNLEVTQQEVLAVLR